MSTEGQFSPQNIYLFPNLLKPVYTVHECYIVKFSVRRGSSNTVQVCCRVDKETFQRDFDLPFVSSLEPDQPFKIFSSLFKISPSYSNCLVRKNNFSGIRSRGVRQWNLKFEYSNLAKKFLTKIENMLPCWSVAKVGAIKKKMEVENLFGLSL